MKKILFRNLIACVLCLALPCSALALTVAEENELGKKFFEQVKASQALIQDPIICNYVSAVGKRVVSAIGPEPLTFRFYVLDQGVLNAFAGPGGYIFVNRGVITSLNSEDELAGILAHESAHVSCRHISKKISSQKKIQLATLAGVVAGLFLGAGAAGVVLPTAAGASAQLAYSREDEGQADDRGVDYMVRAGYGAQGMMKSFSVMRQASLFGPNDIPTYLSTHPGVDERLAAMDTWIATHPEEARATMPPDPTVFAKVRARTIALYGDPDTAKQRLAQEARKNPSSAAALYGLGLAQCRMNERVEAVATLKKAVALAPFDPDILAGLGRAYYEAGQPAQAESVLASAAATQPDNAVALYWLGRTELSQGKAQQSMEHLQQSLAAFPDFSDARFQLAQACAAAEHMAAAHYHLGLHYLNLGDMMTARKNLEKAKDLAEKDPELLAKIEKALEDLEELPGGKGKGKPPGSGKASR
ncbi:MAG: M48 family metalloprotease [Thermodesulfobacteriota bacterium]